jgi:hypothetical protein
MIKGITPSDHGMVKVKISSYQPQLILIQICILMLHFLSAMENLYIDEILSLYQGYLDNTG